MSKTKYKVLLAIFLILLFVSSYCFATVEPTTIEATLTSEQGGNKTSENQNNNEPTIPTLLSSDLYISDDVVNINEVVDGNAFILGKEVTISGEIGGDLFVIADKLHIDGGYVYNNLFACANEIIINGVVYDTYAICNTFSLESNGFIYRDMKVSANSINILGRIKRNAYITAKNVNFNQDFGTIIYGDLYYSNNSELTIPDGIVAGEIKNSENNAENVSNTSNTILYYVLNLLQALIFTFVVTLLLLWLTPKFIERVGKMSVKKSFVSLGIGFVAPIAFVIIAILLLLSRIGTQLLIVSTFTFTLLATIGFSIASIFLGKLFTKIFKKEGNIKFVLFTLISCLILWAISQIPVVGGIFGLIISIFGIGTTLVNMVYRKEKEETKVDEI